MCIRDRFYVTDGHHRLAAASEALNSFGDAGGPLKHIQAVLFPDTEMLVLPFHRRVQDREGRSFEKILEEIKKISPLTVQRDAEQARPQPGQVGIYIDGCWYTTELPTSTGSRVVDLLDVSRLQSGILEPVFDIKDPGSDPIINYVPEPVGISALELSLIHI